eukprot:CAMPEP_0175062332 /NCGR_PEP_ID=MMETSP0052_2-20121109/14111_1 /TAXON_ID=51329 ORGANISM="Polytomella parva, Strain SAG 63-3" /NCGR_SAMPLE_ID=MMETSP0052_2 /ASSEMBLY_ACC=CAM_ASM_000194 /LENGTH=329 /DNA_ID=CAMNT_0016328345 /DNA_START=95 /DNA_END=1084 /DNA_ORIENTATION=-
MKGLTVIVTGPTSGIGKDTVEALARKGATVILACRTTTTGEKVRAKILADAATAGRPVPQVEVQKLDLSSLSSVRAFASEWEAAKRPLHVLVNNAGIYAIAQGRAETEDGFESHMASNHLGHFLLTMMLLPCLRLGAASAPSFGARIVNVASSMHLLSPKGIDHRDPHQRHSTFNSDRAYSQSKLAQIQFTRELRWRLEASQKATNPTKEKIEVFAVHPGMVLTDVVRSLPVLIQKAYKLLLCTLLLSPRQGARASVYCASAPDAAERSNSSGGYIDSDCRPTQPSRVAKDRECCRWVWSWSATETKLPPQFDLAEGIEGEFNGQKKSL